MTDIAEQRYARERAFFDAEAAQIEVDKIPRSIVERYRHPRNPKRFALEMMFALLGDDQGLDIFQVGSGMGRTAVTLAHYGHRVVGVDISPMAVKVARQSALIENLDVDFRVGNVVTDDVWGESQYDVVWCQAVLHHLIPELDVVMRNARRALKPGGLFIALEPLAVAPWLASLRRKVPVKVNGSEDERPLEKAEVDIIKRHFPDLAERRYRILARIDRFTRNVKAIGVAAAIDNVLLAFPGSKALSSTSVMWARKPN